MIFGNCGPQDVLNSHLICDFSDISWSVNMSLLNPQLLYVTKRCGRQKNNNLNFRTSVKWSSNVMGWPSFANLRYAVKFGTICVGDPYQLSNITLELHNVLNGSVMLRLNVMALCTRPHTPCTLSHIPCCKSYLILWSYTISSVV
jgi:hypothetical protein